MIEMMKLPDADERLRALVYMRQFNSRLSELRNDIKVIESACDDVKMCLELRKLLKVRQEHVPSTPHQLIDYAPAFQLELNLHARTGWCRWC